MGAKKNKNAKVSANAKAYTLTDEERAAAARLLERIKRSPALPRFKVETNSDSSKIGYDHENQTVGAILLSDALGISDEFLRDCLVSQLADVAGEGKAVTSRQLNNIAALVAAISPRDSTEAILACQMAAIHNATMTAARRLSNVETIPQQDSASNMLNKLARTFTTQMETLKKYRSTGEQNIRVQHVNVSASQAVVGINQGGGGAHENPSQSHAPCRDDECGAALLSHEQAVPMSMPGTGGEREVCVPDARSPRGSTDGET